jgi:TRAP-type C4-dicarboxylate transport system substrate-binding protein
VRQVTAKVNLVPMERIWDLGFRQITNSIKPIKSAADLAGMKLRVPARPSLVSLFKALGTHPVSMQFGEVYTSLQTKVVDGQEKPLSIIDAGKFYEVQKFCSITNQSGTATGSSSTRPRGSACRTTSRPSWRAPSTTARSRNAPSSPS